MRQIRTFEKFVVANRAGTEQIDYDPSSGGYPYVSKYGGIGHIFPSIEKAIESGLRDAEGTYAPIPDARVYRIVLEEVNVEQAIVDISRKRAEEELSRIKQNIAGLRPEDIAYIKKNM